MTLRLCATICVASIMVAQSHFATARAAQQDSTKSNGTMGSAINGIASTYNPFRPGYRSGGKETASGELYDPSGYGVFDGTSFSTPLVSGAAALVKAARPGLTVQQYRSLLIDNAATISYAPGTPASVQ